MLEFFNLSSYLCKVRDARKMLVNQHGAQKTGLQGSVREVVHIPRAAHGSLASPSLSLLLPWVEASFLRKMKYAFLEII